MPIRNSAAIRPQLFARVESRSRSGIAGTGLSLSHQGVETMSVTSFSLMSRFSFHIVLPVFDTPLFKLAVGLTPWKAAGLKFPPTQAVDCLPCWYFPGRTTAKRKWEQNKAGALPRDYWRQGQAKVQCQHMPTTHTRYQQNGGGWRCSDAAEASGHQ